MDDLSMPGAALEAPETFQCLPVLLWPRLLVAVGYQGGARWVALYLSRDQVVYNDGADAGSGDTNLFLTFKRHPTMVPHLTGAHLGSLDEEASECLLVDTHQQVLYLADSDDARRFLKLQWPQYEAFPLEYTPEELSSLIASWHELEALPNWVERLAEEVREHRANARLMQQWLDQQQGNGRWPRKM